jgi:hypothetical protein
MNENIHYVNNTRTDIRPFFSIFKAAYENGGVLHEDFADLFEIEMLVGYNPDGTDRMIIRAA